MSIIDPWTLALIACLFVIAMLQQTLLLIKYRQESRTRKVVEPMLVAAGFDGKDLGNLSTAAMIATRALVAAQNARGTR